MEYKSIRLPKDFLDEIKKSADMEYRSMVQQLIYWATIGKEVVQKHNAERDMKDTFQNRLLQNV